MRSLLGIVAACLLVPASARPSGVDPVTPKNRERVLVAWSRATTLSASAPIGGVVLPADETWTTTGVSVAITSGGGGGAGSTVIRTCIPNAGQANCTDGNATNICACSIPCASTNAVGVYRSTSCTGSCTYVAGSKVMAAIPSDGANCTTTQPTALNVVVHGKSN